MPYLASDQHRDSKMELLNSQGASTEQLVVVYLMAVGA